MRLPELNVSMTGMQTVELSAEGVVPQIYCRIGDIVGTRTKKTCWNTPFGKKCINMPEVKHGACHSDGADCNDCFVRCKSQFTSAGGWHIKNVGSMKCPN